MFSVYCVLKSGGVYSPDWVAKLKRGVGRHLSLPHRFVCLSDMEVPDRIPLKHDWPGWWSKIELFAPGMITDLSLYLDLDTVIVGSLDALVRKISCYDFAMLPSFSAAGMVGSGVMLFNKVPHQVYEKFKKMPQCYIEHHARRADASTAYIGDQAFIWDALGRSVDTIGSSEIKSFKHHCRNRLPEDASIVCFHGSPRPPEVRADWMARSWV